MKEIRAFFLFFATVLLVLLSPAFSESAEVIIIGDTHLKPVSDVISVIEQALHHDTKTYSPAQANKKLKALVSEENARVVVALGRDALDIAANLTESVPVVYGLLVEPPRLQRQNVTGVYLETSINEYMSLVTRSFPNMRRVGIIYGPDTERIVRSAESPQIKAIKVKNSYEFVNALNSLNTDAFLLLPDRGLLSPTAIESVYLHSFRNSIPVLGISEKHVKEGSLLSLVFDGESMGRQLGEVVKSVLSKGSARDIPPVSPQKLNLYINTDTARKMNIPIPDELLRRAKKVYP